MTDSKTVVEDLAGWLTAVWDEEERLARRVADRYVQPDGSSYWPTPGVDARFDTYSDPDVRAGRLLIKRHGPASVLARIAADRKILALHEPYDHEGIGVLCSCCAGGAGAGPDWPCETVLLLASPYADRPSFRPEWLVVRQGVEQ